MSPGRPDLAACENTSPFSPNSLHKKFSLGINYFGDPNEASQLDIIFDSNLLL